MNKESQILRRKKHVLPKGDVGLVGVLEEKIDEPFVLAGEKNDKRREGGGEMTAPRLQRRRKIVALRSSRGGHSGMLLLRA